MTHPTPEHLGAYLDGELDAAARVALDAHLGTCADCSADLASLAAVDMAARKVPLEVPAGYFDDFAPRVRAGLEKRAPARWRPPVWGWAAAAALLLGVVTPLALRERSAPSVQFKQTAEPAATMPLASGVGAKQDSAPEAAADAPGVADSGRDAELQKRSEPFASPPAAPAMVPARPEPRPQAEAPKPLVSPDSDARANATLDDRLSRRDASRTRSEGAAMGGMARPSGLPPSTQAAPAEEQAKRELDAAAEAKLQRDEYEQAEAPRASGYTAPPPPPPSTAGQRQHGPRSQNTAATPAPPLARKSAAEPKTAEPPKDKEQATDAVAEKGALGATTQESVTVTGESRGFARGRESMKFRSLAHGKPPRSDAEARALRESWRAFASEHPDLPEADEARVQLVEAGALAYRLGRRPQDREVALRDARAYLERPQAPQAERVRALLKTLETSAP